MSGFPNFPETTSIGAPNAIVISPYVLAIARAHVYRSAPIHGEPHTHSPWVFLYNALEHRPPRAQACGRPSPEDLWLGLNESSVFSQKTVKFMPCTLFEV